MVFLFYRHASQSCKCTNSDTYALGRAFNFVFQSNSLTNIRGLGDEENFLVILILILILITAVIIITIIVIIIIIIRLAPLPSSISRDFKIQPGDNNKNVA